MCLGEYVPTKAYRVSGTYMHDRGPAKNAKLQQKYIINGWRRRKVDQARTGLHTHWERRLLPRSLAAASTTDQVSIRGHLRPICPSPY
jgi:hypothetical protein